MSAAYTFVVLHDSPQPELEGAWRELLRRVELPSHYCAPEFFKEPFWAGRGPFAVLALDQHSVVGVVTGIREGDEVQCGQSSRPQICRPSRSSTASAECCAGPKERIDPECRGVPRLVNSVFRFTCPGAQSAAIGR